MKIKFPVISILFLSVVGLNSIKAQELDFTDVLRAGVDDASLYLENYIDPFMKGFGYGFSNGWYNTAKPHKPLGLDITVTANVAFVPDKDLLFDFEGFENTRIESGPEQLPTIFGPSSTTRLAFNTTTEVSYEDPDPTSPTFGQIVMSEEPVTGEFDAPDGLDLEDEIGYSLIPVPMVQLGVGLIENTELKLRWFPTVSTDDFEFKFFGLGVMHDFKQWTPGISHLPFDMSGFVGFTRLSAETKFDPEDLGDLSLSGENQVAGYSVTSITMQVVASKKLSVLTVYGGFGYSITNSNLKMTGTYIVDGSTDIELADGTVETVESSFPLEDPINLDFTSTSPRATIGARVKLLIVTLSVDYTIQEYNTLTAGVGFSIR